MTIIKIPEQTDLNKIIGQLNQSRNAVKSNPSDLHFERWIFDALPGPLPKLMSNLESPAKKDTALLAILTILSATIKNYKVDYDGKMEGCQLYTYILGDPAQGKGSIAKYMKTGTSFHALQVMKYREQYAEYKTELTKWEESDKKGEKPTKPFRNFLFLAGNSSKASLIKELEANNGYGLIFETEADTLYTANKNDFGNFTDILRKGFHSENLSVNRVGFEDGPIEIEQVTLSVLLTSTLDQCFKIMPTYDNGLHSRFAFYILPQNFNFNQVFKKKNTKIIDAFIYKLARLFKSIGIENLKLNETVFSLTEVQVERFNGYFQFINDACVGNKLLHLMGSVHRMGLILTRISMLLTYLREYTINNKNGYENDSCKIVINKNISCNDIDFEIALSITKKLMNHLLVLDNLYNNKNPKQQNSYFIHGVSKNRRYDNETKLKAMNLKKTGLSYSEVSRIVLGNSSLKGTIQKWCTSNNPFPVSETETANSKTIEVNSSLQAAKVSFFDHVTANRPSEILSLYSLLTYEGFREKVKEIRMAKPDERKKMKIGMPAFTVSGVFDNKRQKESLDKHSGFICIDIDSKDNNHITNFQNIKQELKNIINVAYTGKSVSGESYFAIIPIEEPSRHEEYFMAIEEGFKFLGINIDKSGKDVSRLRIVSYDETPYMAIKATIINKVLEEVAKKEEFEFVENDKFMRLVTEIEEKQIDITTQAYLPWFGIGCGIANTFGEGGRKYFHSICKFNNSYNKNKSDYLYSACLKTRTDNGYTLGTLFYFAMKSGIIF